MKTIEILKSFLNFLKVKSHQEITELAKISKIFNNNECRFVLETDDLYLEIISKFNTLWSLSINNNYIIINDSNEIKFIVTEIATKFNGIIYEKSSEDQNIQPLIKFLEDNKC